jgi:hypothetical protein
MKLVQIIEFLRRRLKTVIWVCVGVLAALVAGDIILVNKEPAHTALEKIPFFWAVFGFLGCAVIILVSKWFGHSGIMKREDYYDE